MPTDRAMIGKTGSDGAVPRLVPAPGRLVVEALEETMWGGLYLPVKTQEKPMMGRVIGISEEARGLIEFEGDDPMVYCHLDEIVVFGQNSGMQVDIGAGAGRRRAIILREQDVLAKVVYDQEEPIGASWEYDEGIVSNG